MALYSPQQRLDELPQRPLSSGPITQAGYTDVLGTVNAAEHLAISLNTVTNDSTAAMGALRSHGVNRALEAVEYVVLAALADLNGLVVLVSAGFASCHIKLHVGER